MECPYGVLGVSKECTADEIKKAYVLGVRKTHPDITKRNTDAEFIRISEAYSTIISTPRIQKMYVDWESLPYIIVELSNAKSVKCRCGSIYDYTQQIGPVECMSCSHYIEVIPDGQQ
ncbi:hypothetical protein NEIG_00029 [Nematocida sp. ERTm5]|nr:hypothetical protein NEIG_00029 [Nematocida sp. ERTm5]